MDDARVVCAAIKNKRSGLIVTGARHFDMVMHAVLKAIKKEDDELNDWLDAYQGFIDQRGNFLTRQEAHDIAVRQEQASPQIPGVLYSEDLY